MEFTINTKELLNALKEVKKTISKNDDRVQIVVTDGVVQLAGYMRENQENESLQVYTVPAGLAMVAENGGFMVPYSFLEKVVRKFKTGFTSFKYDTDRMGLIVSHDNNSFILDAVTACDEILTVDRESDETGETIEVQPSEAVRVLGSVLKSVSTQESRPVLTGVHLIGTGEELTAIATDSHRLTVNKMSYSGVALDRVIKGVAVKNIVMDLKKVTEPIKITLYKEYTAFSYGNKVYTSKDYDGAYPDVSRLIPQEFDTEITTQASDLLELLDNASILSKTSRSNVVRLETDPDSTKLSATSVDFGNYEGQLNAVSDGETLDISFNSGYILDAIKPLKKDKIRIQFGASLRPFVIKTDGDKNLTELVTPVRTY